MLQVVAPNRHGKYLTNCAGSVKYLVEFTQRAVNDLIDL